MKVLIIFVAAFAAAQTLNCLTGDNPKKAADVVTAACKNTETKCVMPDNTQNNNTFTKYGCAAACETTDAAKKLKCKECDSADDCNAYVAPNFDFKCLVNGTATACTAGPTVACFMAKAGYEVQDADAELKLGGCGPCADIKKADGTTVKYTDAQCATCDYENCNNGAATMSVLLAPLLAIAFWLH